ncbi:MAG TPA: sugar ABC transporter permease [Pseudonocardiaceae bacterium]|jgi:multiple sugar transport system permease protein|nr:sugar ABC transporter permease [Pseudonocardiaceae bacterium]
MALATPSTPRRTELRPGTAGAPASPTSKTPPRPPRFRKLRKVGLPYLFLLPALLLELLIHLVPMVYGVIMSFLKLTQFYIANWTSAPGAGLDNYRVAIDFGGPIGSALMHSLLITIEYTVLSVGCSWLIGTGASILMQRSFWGRNVLRTIFLIPYALPVYAAVIVWSFMLQRDTGLVNHVLVDQLHVVSNRPFWLIGGNSFWSMLIVSVWRNWPFVFLCVTAGLQSISPEMYEAATLDGATIGQQIRKVTMPLLRPVNQVLVLVLVLWTFNDFNTPYVLFGQSPPVQADVISIHIYQNSFVTWNFGIGSAMSVLLLLFLLVITGVYLLITNRGREHA